MDIKKVIKREESKDVLRGISIMAIVCQHGGVPPVFIRFFYVPVFFILTGYFYKDKCVSDRIKRWVRSLYIPFVVMGSLVLLMHNFMVCLKIYDDPFSTYEIIKKIIRLACLDIPHPLLSPCWFVIALTFGEALFCLIQKLVERYVSSNKRDGIIIVICIAFTIVSLVFDNIKQIVYGNCTIVSLCFLTQSFFAFGYINKKYSVYEVKIKKWKYFKQSFAILTAVLFLLLMSEYDVDYRVCYTNNRLLFIIVPMLGYYWINMLYDILIGNIKWLKQFMRFAGRNSLILMVLHPLFFQVVSLFEINCMGVILDHSNWINVDISYIWIRPIVALTGIAGPLLVSVLLEKYGKGKTEYV